VFGDEEDVGGYQGLSIDIWISARTYHAWVDIKYERKFPKADDLHRLLEEAFPAGYSTTHDQFITTVTEAVATSPDYSELGAIMISTDVVMDQNAGHLSVRHFNLRNAPKEVQVCH